MYRGGLSWGPLGYGLGPHAFDDRAPSVGQVLRGPEQTRGPRSREPLIHPCASIPVICIFVEFIFAIIQILYMARLLLGYNHVLGGSLHRPYHSVLFISLASVAGAPLQPQSFLYHLIIKRVCTMCAEQIQFFVFDSNKHFSILN